MSTCVKLFVGEVSSQCTPDQMVVSLAEDDAGLSPAGEHIFFGFSWL